MIDADGSVQEETSGPDTGQLIDTSVFDDKQEIKIEVVDDRPVVDQVEPRDESRNDAEVDDFDSDLSEQETAALGERTSKRIKRLQYEFHEERRAKEASDKLKEEAIIYAQQRQQENEHLRGLLNRGQDVLLSEVRGRTEADLTAARVSLRKAMEDGDPDSILESQEALNHAQIAKFQADNYGQVAEAPAQMGREKAIPPQTPAPAPAQAPVQAPSQDPKLQTWLGKNTWFGKDDEMTQLAMGVHKRLTEKDGINPYSDEYYNRVDSRLRELVPGFFGESEKTGKVVPAATQVPLVAASPSRSTGGAQNANTVQLTTTAVELAGRLGLTEQQYAKQVLLDNRKKQNV